MTTRLECYQKLEDAVLQSPILHGAFSRGATVFHNVYGSKGRLSAIIYGESGTGKTTLCKFITSLYPSVETPNGTELPVVKVSLPSKPTPNDVAHKLLEAMGATVFGNPKLRDLNKQLRTLLVGCKTKVILIDEMQHYVDYRGIIAVAQMGDWLKEVLEDLEVSVVLVGLPRTQLVLRSNNQMRRRINIQYEIQPFEIKTKPGQQELLRYLRRLESLLPFTEPQRVSTNELLLPLWYASNGLTDYLNKLVGLAGDIATASGHAFLTREHLRQAFQEYIWPNAANEDNPFHADFRVRPLIGAYEPFAPDSLKKKRGAAK